MEKVTTYIEKSPEQEMRDEVDKFINFLERILDKIPELHIDTEDLLLNMHKIFTEERLEQILGYLEDIKSKAKQIGNQDVDYIFMPFDSALFEYQLCMKENYINKLPDDDKINMGGRLYKAMLSLVSSSKFFSEK